MIRFPSYIFLIHAFLVTSYCDAFDENWAFPIITPQFGFTITESGASPMAGASLSAYKIFSQGGYGTFYGYGFGLELDRSDDDVRVGLLGKVTFSGLVGLEAGPIAFKGDLGLASSVWVNFAFIGAEYKIATTAAEAQHSFLAFIPIWYFLIKPKHE